MFQMTAAYQRTDLLQVPLEHQPGGEVKRTAGRFIKICRCVALISLVIQMSSLQANIFDDAQTAARDGRYREVVTILTDALDSGTLEGKEVVIAYSNRGIAYSLLKAYGLAKADLNRAIELEPDHKLTQNHLGIIAEHVDHDYVSAKKWYENAALAGFPASQVNLANLYRQGLGVQVDEEKALAFYRQAADQGYSMAYVPMGIMYMEAQGIPRDYKQGVMWLEKGRAQGVIDASYYLGLAYEKGLGVTPNQEQAVDLFRTAAMQGHGKAQNSLGYHYRRGLGVPQDYIEAVKWYQLAADQNNIQATNRLAWLLATCPTKHVCNGEDALVLAQKAVAAEPSASNLDSLAAAYARIGDFDLAIETIEKILGSTDPRRGRYKNRLSRYSQQQPYQL